MNDIDSKDSGIFGPANPIDHRIPGLGLLSRLLGAVFLVFVCGLLLLDRAVLKANRDQTNLDAQAMSLLAEGFISDEAGLLQHILEGKAEPEHGRTTEDSTFWKSRKELIGMWWQAPT